MMIQNRLVSLIFRSILVIGCFIGLYLNSGLPQGAFSLMPFVYYTILSNLVCFIFFLALAVQTFADLKREGIHGTTSPILRFKGAITMMITATFLIYHFILVPRAFSMNSDYDFWAPANLLVHYFTPFMVILDWLFFDPKNGYRLYDPGLWLGIPLLYLIFILIRAQFGGPITASGSYYPYFFLDVNVLSWYGVLKWVALITVFFILLGYIIYLIDKITFSKGRFHFGKLPQ